MNRAIAILLVAITLSACTSSPVTAVYTGVDRVEMLTVGTMPRSFRIHVPQRSTPGPVAPLILAFHGSSQTAAQLEATSGLDAYADAHSIIVVYPESAIGQWDVAGNFGVLGVDDMAFTQLVLSRVFSEFVVDESRVIAVGLSNGGVFVQRLGCEIADQLVGFVAVAATMPRALAEECHPARPIGALYIMGTEDPFFPAAGDGVVRSWDSTVGFWADVNRCGTGRNVTARPDTAGDGTMVYWIRRQACTRRANTEIDSIAGGGHAWPGAVVPAASGLGVTSGNLSANAEIVRFLGLVTGG